MRASEWPHQTIILAVINHDARVLRSARRDIRQCPCRFEEQRVVVEALRANMGGFGQPNVWPDRKARSPFLPISYRRSSDEVGSTNAPGQGLYKRITREDTFDEDDAASDSRPQRSTVTRERVAGCTRARHKEWKVVMLLKRVLRVANTSSRARPCRDRPSPDIAGRHG